MTPEAQRADEDELLPCPFCGGEMQKREALWPSEGDTDGIIHAAPTQCPLPEFNLGIADGCRSVTAAWNTRARPLPTAETPPVDDRPTYDQLLSALAECREALPNDMDDPTYLEAVAFPTSVPALVRQFAANAAPAPAPSGEAAELVERLRDLNAFYATRPAAANPTMAEMSQRECSQLCDALFQAITALEAAQKALEPFAEKMNWLDEDLGRLAEGAEVPSVAAMFVDDLRLARTVYDMLKGSSHPDQSAGKEE